MRRTLTIVRHGYREDFVDGQWSQEWTKDQAYPLDPDIAPRGVAEAKALGNRIASESVSHVLASPFLRTVHTAHYLAVALNQDVKIENGLHEWMHPSVFPGIARLRTAEELASKFDSVRVGHQSETGFAYPEHTFEEVTARCLETLEMLLNRYEGDLLFVTHADPLAAMIVGSGNKITKPVKTCALYQLRLENNILTLEIEGEDEYLP